jgi:hypothetical protein
MPLAAIWKRPGAANHAGGDGVQFGDIAGGRRTRSQSRTEDQPGDGDHQAVNRAVMGAFIMSALDNGMSMMDVATFWQYIVKGAILLLNYFKRLLAKFGGGASYSGIFHSDTVMFSAW